MVVGAGNSAGQAALHLAKVAARVTIVARADKLAKRHVALPHRAHQGASNVDVVTNANVIAADGNMRLAAVVVRTRDEERRMPIDALFILIGGEPFTEGSKAGCAATSTATS